MKTKTNDPAPDDHHDRHTGLTTEAISRDQRLLKEDGSFNVELRGLPWFRTSEIFHQLIKMTWVKFSMIILLFYLTMNTLFALVYYLLGVQHLTNTSHD